MYYLQNLPELLKDFVPGGIKVSPLMQAQYPNLVEEQKQHYAECYGKKTFTLPLYIESMMDCPDMPSVTERNRSRTQFFEEIEDPDSLFYIAPPETRFSGKIFILIGPKTASSACQFATTMADNNLATLMGQPLRQQPTSFGEALFFQLPHTGIKGTVSHKLFYRPDAAKDDEPTLYPDIEIYPTIDDILNGRDPVFEKVLELIEAEKEQ